MASHPRVLHIVWNLIRGGTEGQCARIAMALAARGGKHRVAVFRREGFFRNSVEQTCGPIYHLDIRHLVRPRTLKEVLKLSGYIQREVFDVVHAWDADAAVFGHVAARWSDVPLITSRRDMGQIYPAWKLALMRRADRAAAAVVTNADVIRAAVLEAGVPSERIQTIPNMLDVAEFDAAAELQTDVTARLPAGRLIVMVARLDPEKDVETFIRAAAQVTRKHDDVSFVIAGDGPQRQALETMATGTGLEHRTIFLGDIKDVPALLRRCYAGVLVPKANEGLSNSILEYMAASLPVIASDCGGNKELVEEGATGFVVPSGNDAATAGALTWLLDNPKEAHVLGLRGRQRVVDVHRPEVVAERFESLYRPFLS